MARIKTFFIYFILVIAFFIFSQIAIYVAINTTYEYKSVEINTIIHTEVEVQATSINGFATGKIKNNTENKIKNKYIKIECYSKNNVLMGTKYVKIDELNANEEKEFEIRFNYNKVDKAKVYLADEVSNGDSNENMLSDKQMSFIAIAGALLFLYLY